MLSLWQDACNLLPQSCLANQLKDLYTADQARVAAGQTPLYFITRYGGGANNSNQVLKDAACYRIVELSRPATEAVPLHHMG